MHQFHVNVNVNIYISVWGATVLLSRRSGNSDKGGCAKSRISNDHAIFLSATASTMPNVSCVAKQTKNCAKDMDRTLVGPCTF